MDKVIKRKILILGASSDIGIEVVKIFLDKNWEVIAQYNINNSKLFKLKKKFTNLEVIKINLDNIKILNKIIKKKNRRFANISSFVCLSGYLKLSTFDNFLIKDFYKHININYLASLFFIRHLINDMKKNKWGRILTISSIGTKFGGAYNTFLYSLSKFMNQFFPRSIKNLAKLNILINCLQIGVTDTKLNFIDKDKNLKKRIELIPLKRLAKPKEVAQYIYFLLSEENTLITSEVINISGGE
jgi:NAD(P)-dependent dehydrogenase (short-subunit alcohol dehydrogenase family)